jgi:drug/metabolite transporter (DMT)-like permease
MGVVMMALAMERIRVRVEIRSLGLRYVIPIVIGLVGAAGLLLAVLHGIEAAIWGAAYLWLGALGSPIDAMLYSVDSMTTRGASGLTLQRHWQMMGALACCCSVSARPYGCADAGVLADALPASGTHHGSSIGAIAASFE